MKYASVCSGIEAATVAWHPLGWNPAWFSEIEKFPSAVLKHHYPNTPNLGDMTKIGGEDIEPGRFDLLVGGTPCQSFSVAGLRKGMADPRGNLALDFLRIADAARPQWVVWENVPGVLSSNRGRDFGAFLGGLAECGYGWAYRTLDAQYFGLAQRRKRVFVVGYLGDWRRSAQVLFERESLCGNPAPSQGAWEESSGSIAKCLTARGAGGGCLDQETANFIPVHIDGGDTSRTLSARHDGSPCHDRGPNVVAVHARQDPITSKEVALPLDAASPPANAIAFKYHQGAKAGSVGASEHVAPTLGTGQPPGLATTHHVRRLTPIECERLQGFPDNYTLIPYANSKPAADGPRYKALGNSMAVPVMRWIGERIQQASDRY